MNTVGKGGGLKRSSSALLRVLVLGLMLAVAGSGLVGCGGDAGSAPPDERQEQSCLCDETDDEDCSNDDEDCSSDDDAWDDSDIQFSSETVDLEIFYSQTVRWRNIELSFDTAQLTTERVESEYYRSEEQILTLTGTVLNRLKLTSSLDADWHLILQDGRRVEGFQEELIRLEPEVTGSYRVDFALPDDADLSGALIEPSRSGDAGEMRLLRVPLDAKFESPYPFTIEQLEGLEMKTLNPDSSSQWEMKILSAQVTLNTDYTGAGRPEYGKKFIELVIQADLVDAAVNDNFWDDDFELRVDGFTVLGYMPGDVLYVNQRYTDGLIFEIDAAVTDFDFLFDLGDPGEPDETQTVSVTLPQLE